MQFGAAQKLQGQTLISQHTTAKHYQHASSTERQPHQSNAPMGVAVGDRVDFSASPRYLANLIFDKISARVAEIYGVDAAEQIRFNPNLDTSPEATAERILTFATGFYQEYREQHEGEADQAILGGFMSSVRDAVNRGFEEARGVLAGLSGFTPEIEELVDKTYQRLQEMLSRFENEQRLSHVGEESEKDWAKGLLFPPPEIPKPPEEATKLQGPISQVGSENA